MYACFLFADILPLDQLCVVWDAMLVRDKEVFKNLFSDFVDYLIYFITLWPI